MFRLLSWLVGYPETGTKLTVERELGDSVIYEQREIREFPPLAEVTVEARKAIHETQ